MNLIKGDLWSEVGSANLILFAANSTVNDRGRLVMGAGSALEARRLYDWLPATIGHDLCEKGLAGRDFLIWLPEDVEGTTEPETVTLIGAFQTKRFWREPALPGLIDRACKRLAEVIACTPWLDRIAMPFPGIGKGGLAREEVLPLLEGLPASVWIYEREVP